MMKYRRILLKLSGEALAGKKGFGVCPDVIKGLSQEILEVYEQGVEIGVVVGGGNFHRGTSGQFENMDRTTSDHMGMLGTVMNALALQDALENLGTKTRVLTSIQMREVAEPYVRRRAVRHLEKGRVIIFAAGTGNPFFTTDTAAALRASEINAEIILKATKVGGIYDKDPTIHEDAKKFDKLAYIDVLNKGLRVMDSTAITMCMDNGLKIIVFNVAEKGNIFKAVNGETIGTMVCHKD